MKGLWDSSRHWGDAIGLELMVSRTQPSGSPDWGWQQSGVCYEGEKEPGKTKLLIRSASPLINPSVPGHSLPPEKPPITWIWGARSPPESGKWEFKIGQKHTHLLPRVQSLQGRDERTDACRSQSHSQGTSDAWVLGRNSDYAGKGAVLLAAFRPVLFGRCCRQFFCWVR